LIDQKMLAFAAQRILAERGKIATIAGIAAASH
jgi:hypothetical protein